MPAPPEACLTCGTAVEPGQEYCLECGARVVPARRFSAVGRAWERRWGRYPGDWMWAALLLGLVAAGSATAGIVAAPRHRHGERHADADRDLARRSRTADSAAADDDHHPRDGRRRRAPSPPRSPRTPSPPGRRATATRSCSPRSRPAARGSPRRPRRRSRRSRAARGSSACSTPRNSRASTPATTSSTPGSTTRSTRPRRPPGGCQAGIQTRTLARSPVRGRCSPRAGRGDNE